MNYKRRNGSYKNLNREEYKFRLIGKQFGNLKVNKFYGYNNYKQIIYECECQCANHTIIYATYNQLISGKKDNCGCLTKNKQSKAKKKYNTYDLSGEYGIGYTLKGEEFYFDLEDYDKIKDYCWNIHCTYVEARDDNKNNTIIKMHRLIMNVYNSKIKVDHIYHRNYDNRKSQLRLVTNQENCMNHIIHKNNTSGVSGVTWDKEKLMWRARIYINAKGIQLGYFNKKEDAINARQQAEIKYFGKYRYKRKEG